MYHKNPSETTTHNNIRTRDGRMDRPCVNALIFPKKEKEKCWRGIGSFKLKGLLWGLF